MKRGKGVIEVIAEMNKAAHLKLKDVDIAGYPDVSEDGNEKRNAVRDRNRLWHTRDIAYTFHQGKTPGASNDKIVAERWRDDHAVSSNYNPFWILL